MLDLLLTPGSSPLDRLQTPFLGCQGDLSGPLAESKDNAIHSMREKILFCYIYLVYGAVGVISLLPPRGIQVARLGSRYLCPLSHLADPRTSYWVIGAD